MTHSHRFGFFALTLALLLSACTAVNTQTKQIKQTNENAPLSRGALKRDEAAVRAKLIEKPVYTLAFKLGTEPDFTATAQVDFILKKAETTFLELMDAKIQSIKINEALFTGEAIPSIYDGLRIQLAAKHLILGPNQIVVEYQHPFETSDHGLYRFEDPVDKKLYAYTNLEPHEALRIFPCFDQPDLKAIFKVSVSAPSEWEVIANSLQVVLPTNQSGAQPGLKNWRFEDTAPISTYLFFLGAGPYQVWKSEASLAQMDDPTATPSASSNETVPLRLFARKSQAALVDFKGWLSTTESALAFFSARFGYPYPFKKLDQIIAPGMGAGGMENVGAITYSERTLSKNRQTATEIRRRVNLQLHEIAHQWFGNLVTLRWWNGLWLNESFATWAAYWAYEKLYTSEDPSQAWKPFLIFNKRDGYEEDLLPTRHPIDMSISDTDAAVSSFDGISYGKGASVLKQLVFAIGEDAFQDGLQRYFKKYAFRVATLADFTHVMEEASGWDLKRWQREWIRTEGLNTVQAQWTCAVDEDSEENEIKTFELKQTADGGLRTHKLKMAVYWSKLDLEQNGATRASRQKIFPAESGLFSGDPIDVEYAGVSTRVDSLIGLPCPSMVLLNLEDHDYVSVRLDPMTWKTIQAGAFSKIKSPLTRALVWQSLWDTVIQGQESAAEFGELAITQLLQERDPDIIQWVFSILVSRSAHPLTVTRILPEGSKAREQFLTALETAAKKGLLASQPGSDLQVKWWNGLLDSASSLSMRSWLELVYAQKIKIKGLSIDGERKLKLLTTLARLNSEQTAEWSTKERTAQDASNTSESSRVLLDEVDLSLPQTQSKVAWVERSLKEPLTPSRLRALRSLHLLGQEEISKSLSQKYADWIKGVAANTDIDVGAFESFTEVTYPSACTDQRIQTQSLGLASLPSPIQDVLKQMSFTDELCIRARARLTKKD